MEKSLPLKTECGQPVTIKDRNGQAAPAADPEHALAFWYGRINYEQRPALPSDLKLERMLRLLDLLGNPHQGMPIVHVAGSKGKGSTSAMIASILRHAGYRTGLFTSPHLCRVEERIEVDGWPIERHELTSLLNEVRPVVEWLDRHGDPGLGMVTFFEIVTALGLLFFSRRGVQAAVLEVGLGGRFDSTNVCHPLVALITSISYDHTQLLGNRLAQIAMEKAGIVKPGRPVLSGARPREACEVIQAFCRERSASLRELDREIRFTHVPGQLTSTGVDLPRIEVTTNRRSWPAMALGLLGEHQAANAALAVAAVEHLIEEGYRVSDADVSAGLAGVRWPGRLEILCRHPTVLLDCAHNVASAEALVDTLAASFACVPPMRRRLIFAGSSDKDLPGMFRVLAPHFAELYLTRFSHNSRSVSPEQLASLLQGVAGVPFTICGSALEAWKACRDSAGADDLICITGSVFLAGELRPVLCPMEQ